MKPKTISKKLVLNKRTIVNVENGLMKEIKGGGATLLTECRTRCATGLCAGSCYVEPSICSPCEYTEWDCDVTVYC